MNPRLSFSDMTKKRSSLLGPENALEELKTAEVEVVEPVPSRKVSTQSFNCGDLAVIKFPQHQEWRNQFQKITTKIFFKELYTVLHLLNFLNLFRVTCISRFKILHLSKEFKLVFEYEKNGSYERQTVPEKCLGSWSPGGLPEVAGGGLGVLCFIKVWWGPKFCHR